MDDTPTRMPPSIRLGSDAGNHEEERLFKRALGEALESLPSDLRGRMSNVAIVVEEEPPHGRPLLGLYQGVPLTRRGHAYAGVPPDKITIYRGAARAAVRLEPRAIALRGSQGRAPRDRPPLRHQRRAPARDGPLLRSRGERNPHRSGRHATGSSVVLPDPPSATTGGARRSADS